ncbi:heavy metal sensor histidine kinase [Alloacidobacterium dinghuense]|uniref:histidine kinase n=1 Tax=Alloacidobacterium dinghuense TaxID=2763107 RepID=A0A7G8BJ39_9BACT|nr:heavy metal sensor histidine kinase [Alloacidobacterium dinghuense]QNI32559.1 heavy metal sensor histidine kinase [Alloacidobacterium dinghuense]
MTSSIGPLGRWWGTLAFRLTAGYAISGLLTVFLATAGLYVVLVSELERSTDLFIADKLNVLGTMLRERPDDIDALREEVELESAARRYEQFYIRLLDQRGNQLMATPGMAEQLDLPQFIAQAQSHPDRAIALMGKQGKPFRVTRAAVPVGSPPTDTDIIQIAVDVSQKEELLARYRRWFGAIMLGTFVIFPVAGYQIARRGIRPVEEMATTARHISSSNLHERILPEGYPVELASLADTFNKMLDRLEESFERISRFSADIAHDLRTPVNNIRGEAEVALARARTVDEYRDVLGSCLEETVRLSDLIGDLLFLARAESPLNHLRRATVDVHELLGSVREYYEASAAEGGISLMTAVSTGPVIGELDRPLIQRAVGNLIANALAHTPPGGTVILESNTEHSTIRIEVSDTGDGIPPEALPRVFDRFYRVDTSRSQTSGGTGLGLAIVQSIMVLHGGRAEIASQPGHGTRVTLHIPAA